MSILLRMLPAVFLSLTASVPALAQNREVDVFFDERGQRILLDRDTGEVLAVEPRGGVVRRSLAAPETRDRRADRRPERPRVRSGPYDLNDAADRARFERDREILLGRREAPDPDYLEPGYDDPTFEEPIYGERDYREEPLDDRSDPSEIARGEPAYIAPSGADLQSSTGSITAPGPGDTPSASGEPLSTPVDPATAPHLLGKGANEDVAKIQVLLDRTGASPGVIDGRMGDNVNKAISAYREMKGEALRTYDKMAIETALAETGGAAFVDYELTNEDVAGQFVASIPTDYGEKAKLENLAYTSTTEMLAERFHMDENYLKAINPDINFSRPGSIVKVVNIGAPVSKSVVRIVADKPQKQVRAYGETGELVAVFPATIGSSDTPSPSGTHAVARIAFDPEYTYNPKLNFKQGENDKVLRIPPGPNGPVGSVWIALDKPTYGIHGTPDPSKIGKTESHGCVRLTNWDARELAKIVKPGVPVEFIE